MGLIYVTHALEMELAPLLASFGLAGLAVSFAAQDTIKNLFGGVTIFLDRPFKIGERILFGGYDGVVEEIGFRTTKIRTLKGHLVTIPNANITSDAVENVGRRPYIRRVMNVTITYDTPREKIEQGVEILRAILDEDGIREPIRPVVGGNEFPPRVYFNDYNAESLNIFMIYWFAPPAYWDYLEHAHKVNLRIFEEFEKAGSSSPSRRRPSISPAPPAASSPFRCPQIETSPRCGRRTEPPKGPQDPASVRGYGVVAGIR